MPPSVPTRSAGADAVRARTIERLRQAVAQHLPAAPPPKPLVRTSGEPPIEQILRGGWIEGPDGPAFVHDEWYALDHQHGALPLGAPLDADPAALAHLLGRPAAPHPGRLAFFDIETTGLSGGTGTYAFLAGLGSFEDGGFRLRQYFLADVSRERAMLAALGNELARFEGFVTYNGRSFDMPFVETRMTATRLRYPFGATPHFDLLHPVRRLYKHRMPACRLADAERRLLRLERFEDVPGALIPALYFDYVRAGRAAPLRGVFRHNAEDVLSLAGVLASLAGLLATDDLPPDDAVAAARWWELAGAPERARKLYGAALPWLEGGGDWPWAAARQARLSRRAGAYGDAAGLWRRLWAAGDASAGLALVKHLEHRERDLASARAITLALVSAAPDDASLRLRLDRLDRKLAKRSV